MRAQQASTALHKGAIQHRRELLFRYAVFACRVRERQLPHSHPSSLAPRRHFAAPVGQKFLHLPHIFVSGYGARAPWLLTALDRPALALRHFAMPPISFRPKYCQSMSRSALPARMPSITPAGSMNIISASVTTQLMTLKASPHKRFFSNPTAPITRRAP